MLQYPILFIGNACKESRKLMQTCGKDLSQCPTVLVFDRKDKNQKRRTITLNAIDYFKVTRLPTLIFKDGSRAETRLSIQQEVAEMSLVAQEQSTPLIPRIQDTANNKPSGNVAPQMQYNEYGQLDMRNPNLKTSMMGDWPSMEGPQQQNQNEAPAGQYAPQDMMAPQGMQQSAPAMSAPPGSNGAGIQPLSYTNAPSDGVNGQEAIGATADVDPSASGAGSATSLRPRHVQSFDEEQEEIGQWPSRRRVNGLTGRKNQAMDTHAYLANKSSQNQMLGGQQMQMGQLVSEPVAYYG